MPKHRRSKVFHAAQHARYRGAVLGLSSSAKKVLVAAARRIIIAPLRDSPAKHVEFYESQIQAAAAKTGLSFARAGAVIDHIVDALYAQKRRRGTAKYYPGGR